MQVGSDPSEALAQFPVSMETDVLLTVILASLLSLISNTEPRDLKLLAGAPRELLIVVPFQDQRP